MKIKSTHESQGEFVIIEDCDFDAETMEKYEEEPEEEEPADGPTRADMKAFLTEKGVTFANNIKAVALADLYAAELEKVK